MGSPIARAFASLPSHEVLTMPALSPTMTEGNISAWKKKEGDAIAAGDILCDVETDKATMEWECVEDGVLAKILVSEGAQGIAVGTPVCVLAEEGEQRDAELDREALGGEAHLQVCAVRVRGRSGRGFRVG